MWGFIEFEVENETWFSYCTSRMLMFPSQWSKQIWEIIWVDVDVQLTVSAGCRIKLCTKWDLDVLVDTFKACNYTWLLCSVRWFLSVFSITLLIFLCHPPGKRGVFLRQNPHSSSDLRLVHGPCSVPSGYLSSVQLKLFINYLFKNLKKSDELAQASLEGEARKPYSQVRGPDSCIQFKLFWALDFYKN